MSQKRGRTGRTGREGPEGPDGPDGPEGPGGPEGPEGPVGPEATPISRSIKQAFIGLTAIFFITLGLFAWLVIDVQDLSKDNEQLAKANKALIIENNKRITEIQASRTESCQRTYEGIREVFKPFFPPPPRTAEQQDNLDRFNEKVDDLKRNCTKQTDPKEAENDN